MSHSANNRRPSSVRFLSEDERKHLEAKVRTCSICGLELLPGEKRAPSVRAHLDCLLGLEDVIERG